MSESDKESNQSPTPEIGNAAGQIPIEGMAPSGKSTLRIVRDGLFGNAKKTLDFIDQAEKDKTVKVRVDDRRSFWLLIAGLGFTCVFMILFLLNPGLPTDKTIGPAFFGIGLIADLFLCSAVIWFVTLRFGVLRTIDPRYAVLIFQLLLGTGIMFALFAFNVVIFFLTIIFKWGPPPPPPMLD